MSSTQTPKWLKDIQENSWNPELLISGLSIVSIFTISDGVNDFLIRAIIDFNLNALGVFFAGLYINFALVSLKISFILHLVLRGIWIGFVGLQYAFPDGIRFDKLKGANKLPFLVREYKQPIDLILLLERICSSIFSFAFFFVGVSLFIIFMIGVIMLLTKLGLPILYVSIFVFSLFMLQGALGGLYPILQKRLGKEDIPVLRWTLVWLSRIAVPFFFRESLLAFMTNINSKLIVVVMLIYSMVMGITGASASDRLILFSKDMQPSFELVEKLRAWKGGTIKTPPLSMSPNLYADDKKPGEVVEKAIIPSKIIEQSFIELHVIGYKRDVDAFEMVNEDSTRKFTIEPLVQVYLDSTQVKTPVWYYSRFAGTGQESWVTMIDVANLPAGPHELRVDKSLISVDTDSIILFEGWATIPFWKE